MSGLSKKNIGWALTGLISLLLVFSAINKFIGSPQVTEMLTAHGMKDWIKILGAGELLSLALFIYPKTMRLGTLLLTAYFGGAILFHMNHPDPHSSSFVAPAAIMVFIWIISWVRGNQIISTS